MVHLKRSRFSHTRIEEMVAAQMPSSLSNEQVQQVFEQVENGEDVSGEFVANAELGGLRNQTGESLLQVAARVNNVPIVKHVLPESDTDDTDNDGWSALLVAAWNGHAECVRLILEATCSVDQPDLMGWTALMWAVYKNQPVAVELLLAHRAHVNLIDEEDGLTPLIVASGRGFADCARILIDHDAQVNACDKFGSTALIWASRKGHLPVVQLLLNAGAEVDAVGMYSSTALMLATRGNYLHVVDLLLSRDPNVNVVDQNGLSALSIAAREGYVEICDSLIKTGAFVNQCDRFGNWILASAVRSGNANIVRMLIDKYADINCQDSENRTPLHLAIDKSFMDIVLLLLEKRPNLENKNKDGETPLLRAVKSRHVALCDLLVKAGAKISATDKEGDNALHLALRARSKRLATVLLTNPQDSRLLYRPNKLGQTPYSIDQQNPQPILPLIFGPVDAEQHLDAMLGYDIYSNVIADILCEPNLQLPLTLGLYAKWGSGKSVLLQKVKESMRSFSRSWLDGIQLRWSAPVLLYIFVTVLIISMTVATIVSISRIPQILIGTGVIGLLLYLLLAVGYCMTYYGSEVRMWVKSMTIAEYIARAFAHIKLLFNVIMLYAPQHSEKDMVSNPVSFLFADYHRLSSIGGEQALAKIVVTLFEAAESHYGALPVRIFCALRGSNWSDYYTSIHGSLRRHCGVPVVLIATAILLALVLFEGFLMAWLFNKGSHYFFVSLVFLAFLVLMMAYPLFLTIRYGTHNVPKARINSAARAVHKLRFEGLMQKLQTEVDLLADMIRSLDAFTNSQTRLVVVVDGLDNCEQERMVSTLDALELLFSARKTRPFVVIIAVDPHIIISAINHNIHSALSGTELTGADYLKNIVNMPFFLHNSALRQLQNKLKEKRETYLDWKERFRRQDTFHGSHLSLRDADVRGAGSRKVTQSAIAVGTRSVGEALMADDYFSAINPRAMRRIINALTLTGRLLRAFEIDFSWLSLGHWVSMLEQWPCRMCWLIEHAVDARSSTLTLFDIWIQLREHIPKGDPLFVQDRNPENFESFLRAVSAEGTEQLTVAHVRKFVPCTSNLDPYLRKLIREKREGIEEPQIEERSFRLPPNAKHLFADEKTWQLVEVPLAETRIEQLISLIKRLDIPAKRLDVLIEKFRALNLNGLVLSTCQLPELQGALSLPLGDWTLLRLLIETLRAFGSNVPGARAQEKRMTTILHEEEEEDDHEEELEFESRRNSISRAPSIVANTPLPTYRKRATVSEIATQMTVDGQHDALMASLADMDAHETEGDIPNGGLSSGASVRFDDDGAATSLDSTESRFGSSDNLLEIDEEFEPMLSRQPSQRNRVSSFSRAAMRGELMSRIHGDSLHTEGGASPRDAGSRTSSFMGSQSSVDNENQLTILRRQEQNQERESLQGLFRGSDDREPPV
ncbi:unnamed protein product, partial [Mesorhabditis belari]|uniref:KAP NTPase domain-containing protein n=1 Tax=Mesorhabditis belari TaxID=2138241 RepID=A0AAF3EVN8_9BILA